jgi:hypothetical protein
MFKKLFIAAGITLTLVGCASTVPMATPDKDAQAKKFVAKPNVAAVYVYRNEDFGKAVKLPLEIDGKTIGQTAYKTYFYAEVSPGAHKVTTRAENTTELTLNAIAGKIYYIWQEVKMGVWAPKAQLQLVDEATGQAGVRETNLAAPVQ